jgi:3-deoxy-D-manno-octulosonate 8-phosphate phosphatase (KDO 8-P phosphatase)
MTDKFDKVRAVAMDVDGVLTDGTFWWGTNGEEFKRFCFADSTGIALAQRAGLKVALISGESSTAGMALVQRFADKLKIADVYKGCHDKAAAISDFAEKNHLQLSEICFIGDDFIDVPAMAAVGLAAAPADAQPAARQKAHLITERNGGHGAVREVLDAILKNRMPGNA